MVVTEMYFFVIDNTYHLFSISHSPFLLSCLSLLYSPLLSKNSSLYTRSSMPLDRRKVIIAALRPIARIHAEGVEEKEHMVDKRVVWRKERELVSFSPPLPPFAGRVWSERREREREKSKI